MKITVSGSLMVMGLLLSGLAAGGEAPAPSPCSISVEMVTRLGRFRTWTNALETSALEEKGLQICQDDAYLNDDETTFPAKCKTEFKLKIFYQGETETRNLSISKSSRVVFSQDYPNNPPSTRMMKTMPTCTELQHLYDEAFP